MAEFDDTIEAVFDRARRLEDPQKRQAYLDRACRENSALREEVESLLAADGEPIWMQMSSEMWPEAPARREQLDAPVLRLGLNAPLFDSMERLDITGPEVRSANGMSVWRGVEGWLEADRSTRLAHAELDFGGAAIRAPGILYLDAKPFQVNLDLDLRALAWICFGVAGGVLFFTGVVMAGAASQFWTLGHTSELQNMLTYGGSAALSYPVSAYSRWFRRVVTYAIPLAFVNYFPALAALNRTREAGWATWVPALSPLACLAMLVVGFGLFHLGLRRYESMGT